MIVTIRTGPNSTAQGELQTRERPFCSCADGYVDLHRCDCPQGWAHRATIRADGKLITGTLIERKEK